MMKITLAEWYLLVDALAGSLRIVDRLSVWRFSEETRRNVLDQLIERANDIDAVQLPPVEKENGRIFDKTTRIAGTDEIVAMARHSERDACIEAIEKITSLGRQSQSQGHRAGLAAAMTALVNKEP